MIRRRIFVTAASGWATKAIMFAVGFFLTPFVLHRLGETHFGLLVLIGAVVAQGGILDLGISHAVVKYVAEYHARGDNDTASNLIATSLSLYCILGVVALILCILIAPVFPDLFNVPQSDRLTSIAVVLLTGVNLAISIPGATSGAVLRGLNHFALTYALSIVAVLASAAAVVVILMFGGNIVEMVAANIPITLVIQAITVWCLRRVAPELRFGWHGAQRKLVSAVFSFSSSMFVMDIAYRVQTQIDEIVIAAFLSIGSVSPYAVARRLSGIPQGLAEQLVGAFVPISSQLEVQGDTARLRSLYVVGSRLTLVICIPLAGVLIVLAEPLLTLWIGAAYAHYAPIVTVLALASVIEVSQWPGGTVLQGIGRHHFLALTSVCAAVANLALSLALLRVYGLMGVALGTLIPAIARFVIDLPYTMRHIGITPSEMMRQVFWPGLIPTVPMLFTLYGIRWAIVPSAIVAVGATAAAGFATYAVIYVVFCAGDAELQLLRSTITKLSRIKTLRMTRPQRESDE